MIKKGYIYDGYKKSNIDNLNHVYVRKYKLQTENGKKTQTTDLSDMRDENCKYSRFLCDLIMEYYYIQHLSFEKVSELLKLNYGLNIDYRRVCDLYNKSMDDFKLKKYKEVENDIRNGKIKLGNVGNYDEEFLYIKHQPYVRLTLIDNKTKIILKDILVPRKLFNRNYIKSFIEDTIQGLNYHTIVTDGDNRYKKILNELGLNQQRCIFHSMQNLMAKINPVHNRLKRRIKTINKKLNEKIEELDDLRKKYKGNVGRPKKEDKKRKKDIKKMKKLNSQISQLKTEKREHKNHIKENNKYVKKISRILKSKSFKKAIEKFNEIYEIKDELSKEIRSHLINLKKYLAGSTSAHKIERCSTNQQFNRIFLQSNTSTKNKIYLHYLLCSNEQNYTCRFTMDAKTHFEKQKYKLAPQNRNLTNQTSIKLINKYTIISI